MFSVRFKGFDDIRKQLNNANVRKALVSTLNKAAASGLVEAKKEIRGTYRITGAALKNNVMRVKRANKSRLRVALESFSKRLALPKLYARQVAKGTIVGVRKGATKLIPHAFIAKMKSGHIGVFTRNPDQNMVGRGRRWKTMNKFFTTLRRKKPQAIDQLTTIGPADMLVSTKVFNMVMSKMFDKWDKTFKHELEYYTGKIK